MLGLRQYGIDINGYVNHSVEGLCLWLQKRSARKPTWPGMWDNFVSTNCIRHSILPVLLGVLAKISNNRGLCSESGLQYYQV